jgi:Ca2+-binding RTX toxin-like protein
MASTKTFRPEVEVLNSRVNPSAVFQTWDGTLMIHGTNGRDFVHVSQDVYGDVVVNDGGFVDVFDGRTVTDIQFFGYRGCDTFLNDTFIDCFADGGAGNDYLEGGWGNDVLLGGTGHDTVSGSHGADQLYGGTGWDTLFADDWDTVVAPGGQWGDEVYWS